MSQRFLHRVGNDIQVSWSGGLLQSAPRISGPRSTLGDATSPFKVVLSQASFFRVQETYRFSVAKSGEGTRTVRSVPSGIDCGADCTEVVLSGDRVTLQATADAGSTFTGWAGDCTGTGDCQILADRPKSVTATFSRRMAANPVANGGFEEGPQAGWQQEPGRLVYSSAELGVQAHSGESMARLGWDQDNRRLARIGQQITLPNSTPLFLNFALWLYSEESCDVPWYDSITVYVAGQVVVNDDRICRGSDTGGWRRYSIGVDAAEGQTVGIVFEISSADALTSIMLLDDISVSNQSWQ